MASSDDDGETTSLQGFTNQIMRGLVNMQLPQGFVAGIGDDGSIIIRAEGSDSRPFSGKAEAQAASLLLAQQYGRPICTGVSVYQPDGSPENPDAPWAVGVYFHSMEEGDTTVLVHCRADERLVAEEYTRVSLANQAALRREREQMNVDAEARLQAQIAAQEIEASNARKREQHRAAALKGWRKRRGEQTDG